MEWKDAVQYKLHLK